MLYDFLRIYIILLLVGGGEKLGACSRSKLKTQTNKGPIYLITKKESKNIEENKRQLQLVYDIIKFLFF